jgi:CoA-binding domain
MSKSEPSTIFDTPSAVYSTVSAMSHAGMRPTTPHQLPPAALALADKSYDPAYSPIVLAGLVRMIEAASVIAVGFIVYVFYAARGHGFAWYNTAAILGIALLAMLAFQVADIYQVQAFRGHEKQYLRLASAWSVVFLIAIGLPFFAKASDQFFRAGLGTFYVFGLFALIAFRRGLFLMVRRWTQEGRLNRRTVIIGCDKNGESLIHSLAAQRDSGLDIIGAFDDRGDDRSPEICAGVPKLGTTSISLSACSRTALRPHRSLHSKGPAGFLGRFPKLQRQEKEQHDRSDCHPSLLFCLAE